MSSSLSALLLRAALVALAACSGAQAAAPAKTPTMAHDNTLVTTLAQAAPDLDRKVLRLATSAMACAMRNAQPGPATLSVIDYSLPSTRPRLWVFDLAQPRLIYQELVAHGRNTGENMASRFSNTEGSFMSSLGAFETQEAYVGANGYSLRLRGLEPGFNDLARERAIVIHGAPYVSEDLIQRQGRLGRSLGCPAVRPAIAQALIDRIRGGSFVFAYYPDPEWLRRSALLQDACGEDRLGHAAPTVDPGA